MKPSRVAVAAAAVLALAGCSTPSGSTAYTVDGSAVSEQTVSDTAAACAPLVPSDGQSARPTATSLRPTVVQLLLRGSLAQAIEKQTNTQVTPDMRSKALAGDATATSLSKDPQCAAMVDGVGDFNALATALGQEKMTAALRQVNVVANPSYGSYDPSQAILDGSSGSLSRQDVGLGKVFG